MKAVLLSIQPRWCELIANGKKTIEVRKNMPKIPTPFKCYIYCTQGEEKWLAGIIGETQPQKLNSKVIGEFVCDKMYGIYYSMYPHDPPVFEEIGTLNRPDVLSETRLSEIELGNYLNGNNGYGWHISALQIYGKPKELDEFKKYNRKCYYSDLGLAIPNCQNCKSCQLDRAPESWCYVEMQDER